MTWLPVFCGNSAALDTPLFTPDGGDVIAPILVEIENPNPDGAIFYTTDGTDPRNVLGGVRSSARVHPPLSQAGCDQSLSVNRSMTVNARIKSGEEWSELKTVNFEADQDFSKLLITEVMYHPNDSGPEYTEFIEFKNIGEAALDLSNLSLIKSFGSILFSSPPDGPIVPSGGFFLLVRNPDIFQPLHPDISFHGLLNHELSNDSEMICLVGPDGGVATRMRYDTHAPWAVVPDNHGYFEGPPHDIGFSLTRKTLDPGADPGHFSTWRASASRLGSPGADDPEPNIPPLLINEIRTRSAGVLEDSVEIYNPTPVNVDIGGWWLSNQRNWPFQYQFPPETIVPGHGYLALDESDFVAGGFALSFNSTNGRCYLFSGDSLGELTGYSHGVFYLGSDQNSSLGRLRTSEGLDVFMVEAQSSFGRTNTGPPPPSLVISEIMYQPNGEDVPYLELHNPGQTALSLWEPDNPLRTWGISGGPFGFTGPQLFPENTVVPPGGYLICAPPSFDPRKAPDHVEIITISDSLFLDPSGIIQILRPSGLNGGLIRWVLEDEARFQSQLPWDPGAAGGGQGLERIDLFAPGSEPKNWCAGPEGGTPGYPWEGHCQRSRTPEISVVLSPGQLTFSFQTESDYYYSLEESNDLMNWQRIPEPTIRGNGSRMSLSQDFTGQRSPTYFRVIIDDKP